MSLRALLSAAAGPLAVVAAIALASPGVKVSAEAEASAPSASALSLETAPLAVFGESAGECSVDAPPSLTAQQVREMTRDRLLAQMAQAGPDEEIRPLNGRGYNYRTDQSPMAQMAILQAELEQQRAGQQPAR